MQKRQLSSASLALALFGALALLAWWLVNDGSSTSLLLLLSGIGVVTLAILLYFFSPAVQLRAEVSDAMALSSVLSLNRMLTSLLVTSRGIHVPSGQAGAPKLFLPVSASLDESQLAALRPGDAVFDVSGSTKGIMLTPPGRGLLAYAHSIGASFTEEGLENEIKDVLENGLEIASRVTVRRNGKQVSVEIKGLACQSLCDAVRREDEGICARTCCPICSFIACMVAEGLDKKVLVESVKVSGGIISITYGVV